MSNYRIEWLVNKNPKADSSTDFYEYYDEYQKEWGPVAFETYKRYCRTALSIVSFQVVEKKVAENEGNTDTTISKYEKNEDKQEFFIQAESYKLRTIDDLIAYAEIDTEKWECFKTVANKWGSVSNDCYQIKGWFRLKDPNSLTPEEYAKEFHKLVEEYIPIRFDYPEMKLTEKDNLAEIALFDFHFGHLIWGEEAQGQDYNIEIASQMFDDNIDYFIERTKGKVEKYLLPLGNDFFNSDSIYNATTAGTPQHESAPWKKSFLRAEELFIRNIDKLANLADVDIIIIPGNHDEQRIFYMGQFLKAWYRNSDRVNVEVSLKHRQYYPWGKSLIGFTHGKHELKGSLPILMCQEAPVQFSQTKYHEWHTGHFHSYAEKKVRLASDNFGIREIILPTFIPIAEYASRKGYMQLNESMCFIWNKDRGKTETLYYHI